MNKLIIKDVLEKIGGNLVFGNELEELNNFSINTKEIINNGVFIGIKGTNVDGSIFYLDAFNNGAKGCIVNKGAIKKIEKIDNKFLIEVDDTVVFLQELAKLKRSMYDIPVVAVTGSVGKTSTKDIIAKVLSTKYNVLKTEGNHNNEIGMPLTILGLKDENALVLEMGMSALNEISVLSKIARPTIAVITNVGTAHIGNLGSREKILEAKLEILDGLDGKLIINNDNDMLHNWNKENKLDNVVTIGITNESDYVASEINITENKTTFKVNNTEYTVNKSGTAFVYNSLSAIAVADILNINNKDIKYGLENFSLTTGRNEVINVNNYTLINDCYNASLDSIKEALNNLSNYKGRKIAVLGDVLELGDYSKEIHTSIGEEVLNSEVDIAIYVGNEIINAFNVTKDKIDSKYFENNNDAIKYIKSIIKDNDVILVKASNGMKFIEIVDSLK